MSTYSLITSTAAQTPALSAQEFLWRPLGNGLESSFHTSLGPRAPELGPLPASNADLVSLAILVYLVDRTAPRPRGTGLATRELELSIPVADPGAWNVAGPALEDLLRFLSGDEWRLTFNQGAAQTNTTSATPAQTSLVALLSGGADSLAGALLGRQDGVTPALLSH